MDNFHLDQDKSDLYCAARQPVLDRNLNTYGYELLFRSDASMREAQVGDGDQAGDQATGEVAIYGFVKTQEEITPSKKIFINFTEGLLLSGAPRALPSAITVVEVLEDIAASPAIIEELQGLKKEGYLIALDDYEGDKDKVEPLLDLADIIKVDVLGKSDTRIQQIYNHISNLHALKLAEKVETRSGFEFMREMGFDLFQGFFFARPENFSGKRIKAGQSAKLRVISALNSARLETEQIVELVSTDPSIAYRLLRLLNSAAFGLTMRVESVRHAVTLLGNDRMRHWLRMIVLSDINGAENPVQLLQLSLWRARFLGVLVEDNIIADLLPENMFLFGLFSVLDVMLEVDFEEIFKELPLSLSFREGYTDHTSSLGCFIPLMVALEHGEDELTSLLCDRLAIPEKTVTVASFRAAQWAEVILGEII